MDLECAFGFAVSAIIFDLVCEASHFKTNDAFDLSDLHSQLSCLRQLSEYQWKSIGFWVILSV